MNSHATSAMDLRPLLQQQGLLPRGTSRANASLLALLEALGWNGDARALAELLQVQPRQLQWRDLANVVRALGYGSDERRARLRDVHESDMPCLFLPDDKREIPLLVLQAMDGALLTRTLEDDHVQPVPRSAMPGTVMRFFEAENPALETRAGQWFRGTLQRFRGQLRDVLMLGLCINLLGLSVPLFTMLVYDRVIAGRNLDTLYYLLAGVAIALLGEGLLRALRGASLAWFGVRMNHLIAIAMFQRLLSIDPLSIERAPPAAQLVRAKAMESVRDFLTGQGFILFIEFPFIPLLLLVLLAAAPMMALACFITALLLCGLLGSQLRAVRQSAQRSARAMAQRHRDALEIFTKLETLRSNGLSDALYARFCDSNRRALRASNEVVWRMQVIEHLVLATGMLGGLLTLAVGVEQVWQGGLTPGGLIACMIIAWRVVMPMQQIAAIAPRLEQVNGGIQQLEQLLALPPEREQASDTATTHRLRGQVELVNVAMRYPRQLDAVFAGLSLSIAPGEMVAIAGANGSGKSSVLKLVNGMYKQAAGSIRLDGVDIRQLDPLGLRRGISYIPQSVALFNGTVRENLMLAAPLAHETDLLEALERAEALAEVMELPEGLDTPIGAHGLQLPQVLAFKLGLARAYMDLKPLVLCDELPYALLNTQAGDAFKRQLMRLKGRHTILLVAHTSDLVKLADQAMYLRLNRRPVVGRPDDILPLMLEHDYDAIA